MGMTLNTDFPQHPGVVYHSAKTQQVFAIRLASSKCPEERRIDNLSQAFIMDIIRSHMDKDAGLYITVRINMKEVADASDAATHVRGIIPEINGEDWLLVADAPRSLHPQQLPLPSGGHQTGIRVKSHRYVEELPANEAPFLY